MAYALVLVRSARLSLEAFAQTTSTHPDLVRRLVALGVLDADRDAAGELCPKRSALVCASCSASVDFCVRWLGSMFTFPAVGPPVGLLRVPRSGPAGR